MAIEKNVPSQLDEEDLAAELEIEMPGALEKPLMEVIQESTEEYAMYPTEDGGVEIDFDPMADRDSEGEFYDNLAEYISDTELARIAGDLQDQYESNKASRQDWEDSYANGLELLGFSYEERTQPFRGASGVTHPLLAEAATQFQAQAFNELLPSTGPVRTAILGE